jgi:esterase/lipase superfamily enzyme
MGNWVAIEALRQMAIRDKRIAPKIKTVMLAAPDVDVDVFQKQIVEMGAQRPHFVLFTSRNDKALALSSRVWGSVPRLGGVNPNAEPYRSELANDHIEAVDLTNVRSPDSLGHTTFAESPEIVRLIGTRLASGQTLNDARIGLGDRLGQIAIGATSTVGQAADVALSAPLSIVDPTTRENLGDKVDQLGHTAVDTVTLRQQVSP